ncbi:hypothetical protein EJ04DRAFT_510174 [Polyplosphaeria fusca]|uniref:Uncharacterized protein n=1 Tax=Polyplosphaeria fusca TaxID=682080 RepID=A0A9P4R5T9_9PLEO|nr:hypothetical protein EJ04DRAFT_510174 [Polyplosphaeria fusca]
MSQAIQKIPKQNFTCFHLLLNSSYKAFKLHPFLKDVQHPLNPVYQRKRDARDQTGLWWHVTVNSKSAKKKVVKSWLRRRLRNAFIESLKERGVDEDGKLVCDAKGYKHTGILGQMLEQGQELSLKGSLNLQALNPLVTAKFADVKKQTGKVVDTMLDRLEADITQQTVGRKAVKRSIIKSQWSDIASRRAQQHVAYSYNPRERVEAVALAG